jgi:hypothetical protein
VSEDEFAVDEPYQPAIDTYHANMKLRAILGANNLGIFEIIGKDQMSLDGIAKGLGTDPHGTQLILDCLVDLSYLEKVDDNYSNTPMAVRTLVPGGEEYVGNVLRYISDHDRFWQQLEEALRAGKPMMNYYDFLAESPQRWKNYFYAMAEFARMVEPELTAMIELPSGSGTLLDLGGSHGLYSTGLCRKYPDLSVTIFEYAGAIELGEEIVANEGMAEQINYVAGDYREDDIGSGYEAVLIFNTLSENPPQDNRLMLKTVYDALDDGGIAIITDYFLSETNQFNVLASLFGLELFITQGGEVNNLDEVRSWIEEAGFDHIEEQSLDTDPGVSMLVAVKKSVNAPYSPETKGSQAK